MPRRWASRLMGCTALAVLLLLLLCSLAQAEPVVVWHSYRGEERQALEQLARKWNDRYLDREIELLAIPYEAYANKLSSAIPNGNGPDLFIFAHERVGDWSRSGLIDTVTLSLQERQAFVSQTLDPLTVEGKLYGWPLAFKSLALLYNKDLMDSHEQCTIVEPEAVTEANPRKGKKKDKRRGKAKKTKAKKAEVQRICHRVIDLPQDTRELRLFLQKQKRAGRYGLAYESGSFYHHAPWLFGFGGSLFRYDGSIRLDTPANADSFAFVARLTKEGLIPEEASGALVTELFNSSKAAMVINGPWFLGELDEKLNVGIAALPIVSTTGKRAKPFLTVEAALLSTYSTNKQTAIEVARYLALGEGARVRAEVGRQAVADRAVVDKVIAAGSDEMLIGFMKMADQSAPMPNNPMMRAVWEPAAQALRKTLRGASTATEALQTAQARLRVLTRPKPQQEDARPYLHALAALIALGLLFWILSFIRAGGFARFWRGRAAYLYLLPMAVSLLLLVFVPFIVGTAVAFFAHREGSFTFVGLANFFNIISSSDYAIDDPLSFYFTLGVTVMWTAVNVFLHVSVGLMLALLLRDPWMRLRGVYRVLLIVPWAVPNYITALIWKGMFHKQFGAINALIVSAGDCFGLDIQPVSWFSHFWTSFAANVATNTWLGFPFMMVVTLGALQAIPRDLEEAAEIDGAGRITRFFRITLPLLKPALLPAVILGSVWTFNMFNIIYLVSGGEPDGATEILITEAYRWAFTRQEQYGYAAAYATLIFLVLLTYSSLTRRLVGAKEV